MRTRELAVASAAVLCATFISTSASGNEPGSVRGTAGNFLATASVDAHNTGPGTAATGWFHASGNLLLFGSIGSFDFQGPVTCLDIEGNRAGLIYPITEAQGPIAQYAKGQAIYVTIVDNGPTRPSQIGFIGPAPLNDLTHCPPLATELSATFGRYYVNGG